MISAPRIATTVELHSLLRQRLEGIFAKCVAPDPDDASPAAGAMTSKEEDPRKEVTIHRGLFWHGSSRRHDRGLFWHNRSTVQGRLGEMDLFLTTPRPTERHMIR